MGKTILVVDDEKPILDLLRMSFVAAGHQVVTAEDPNFCQAIATESSCQKNKPCCDIMIIDYSMPTMNGLDFLKDRVKRHCKGSAVPAAIMSGCLPKNGKKLLENIGCSFFPKPFRVSTLLKWVESHPD